MTLIELFIILFTLIGLVVGIVLAFDYGLAGAGLGAIAGGGLGYILGALMGILAICVGHLVLKLQGEIRPPNDGARNESTSDSSDQ